MVRLSQLTALPDLQLTSVYTSGDPELSWVSTTELLDLGSYLEGGELILTTGLALSRDDPRWLDFVAGLSRARVAAIGFGVGVHHNTIPETLIRAASTYAVSLIEVPLPTPFIAVSKAVGELIRADELRAAREAMHTQLSFFTSPLRERTAENIISRIASATGKHLALIRRGDDGDTLLASTAGFPAHSSTAAGARAPETASHPRTSELIEYLPLDARGDTLLAVAGGTALTAEGRSVLNAGAIALGLDLHTSNTGHDREREQWERLTASALFGRSPESSAFVLDPRTALPKQLRVLALQGTAEHVSAWRHAPRHGTERLITSRRAVAALHEHSAAPKLGLPEILPPLHNGIEVAWQLCPDTPEALQHALRAAAHHQLGVIVGATTPLSDAALSYRSATSQLNRLSPLAALYSEPYTPEVFWADTLSPITDLLRSAGAAAVQAGRAMLGRLAHDAPGVTPGERALLRDTLTVFLSTNGQRGPAAKQLGIHRNTLRDRLTRAEELSGRSLHSADDRAALWLALQLDAQHTHSLLSQSEWSPFISAR